MQSMAQQTDRHDAWLSVKPWLALACWLLSTGLFGASSATAETRGVSDVPIGLRCETRPQFRRVARRDFVVDPVTECRLLAFGCPAMLDEPARSLPQAPIESAPPEPQAAEIDTKSPTRADRRAAWTTGRRRLANAQYDRSVRALSDLFRAAAR